MYNGLSWATLNAFVRSIRSKQICISRECPLYKDLTVPKIINFNLLK